MSTTSPHTTHIPPLQHCRFRQGLRGGFEKDNKHIPFSSSIDIAPFTTNPQQKALYRLCGTVVHSGGMGGGHYIAYVRKDNGVHDSSSRWYYISDSSCKESSLKSVLSSDAYILFYERVLSS